ncbi:hypothetical protein CL653_00490 [bacterium]|nr:hypothetical protein [bacterium]|tara:strand:+ start:875 stop:1735 length:861 start_codon:yes stop_codon:yes gene_type:complete
MTLYTVWFRIVCVTTLFAIGFLGVIYSPSTEETSYLAVNFLAVGQGDAIFITTPSGKQILIDGGRDSRLLSSLRGHLSFFDRSVDLLISTHPDLDHIGGLIEFLPRYKVSNIIYTEAMGNSKESDSYHDLVVQETSNIFLARKGQVVDMGDGVTITILSPTYDPSLLDSNAGSIVVLLEYGNTGFMLTGDAPQAIENYLVDIFGDRLEADVLKLGHHGSKTSTSQIFLDTVSPIYAIVSAGKNNTYGHPHEEVVERIEDSGAAILSTIEGEDVSFLSDGYQVWINK